MASNAIAKVEKPDFKALMAKVANPKATVSERANAMGSMVEGYSNDLTELLPKHIDFDRMKQMFILNIKQTPKLLDCEPASLLKSLFTASAMGLEPDPYFGQIYLIPFGNQVQVIPGYKGIMKLVRNSGEIDSICCEAVHQEDHFEYELGTNPKVVHRPFLGERGEILAFYCVTAFKDGSKDIKIMTRGEVDKIRDASANYKNSKNKPATVWALHYEEMGKKTIFRRAAKTLPISLTREARNAFIADDAASQGRTIEVDMETGEILDIFAETTEVETPTEATPKVSRLDGFAGTNAEEKK